MTISGPSLLNKYYRDWILLQTIQEIDNKNLIRFSGKGNIMEVCCVCTCGNKSFIVFNCHITCVKCGKKYYVTTEETVSEFNKRIGSVK